MNIKRTLLISSSSVADELVKNFRTDLEISFGKKYADLLLNKFAAITFRDGNKIENDRNGEFVEIEKPSDSWNIPFLWKSFDNKSGELESLIKTALELISLGEDDIELKKDRKTNIDDNINILVILPIYKPFESVFLPFIIQNILFRLGIPGFNYHIIGLLPDLEDFEDIRLPSARAYASITECEKLLLEKQDLINSFALLSGRNEKNIVIGKLKDIIPTLHEFLKMSFLNHQTVVDIRSGLPGFYREKPPFFSSLGLSSYIFKKERFLKHFETLYIIKSIDIFFEKFRKPVDRDLFSSDLNRLIGILKWDDHKMLIEGEIGFTSFSKINSLNVKDFDEIDIKSVIETIINLKDKHENKHDGYFRKDYLPMLSKRYNHQLKESQTIIFSEFRNYLTTGIEGIKKAKALLFSILGKDDDELFLGDSTLNPLNLRIAREEIAEYYKSYLSASERLSIKDLTQKEKIIKSKQEEIDTFNRKTKALESKLFGEAKVVTEIERTEEQLFFTVDGQKINISGAKDFQGTIPETIKPYEPKNSNNILPKIIDLRPYLTPVEDQLQIASCTANAIVGAYEYLIKRGTDKTKDLSRLFVYYNARTRNGNGNVEDTGSSAQSCIESMIEHGVCLEETWKYVAEIVNIKPNDAAYQESQKYKVFDARFFPDDFEIMKQCLAEGLPFAFSFIIFKSFHKASYKGIVPLPEDDDLISETHGSHAMLCVGYSDEDSCFIVRNSWGSNWGDKGYCYIPYDYFRQKHSGGNNFIIKTISDININEKEIVKNIGRDTGSLFNLGYDINDLNVYKENIQKLKNELESLIPELNELRSGLTIQREKVLSNEFRKEAENSDIEENDEKVKLVIDEITKIDLSISSLKNERIELIAKRKKIIQKLTIIYPLLFMVFLIVLFLISIQIWTLGTVTKFLFSNITDLLTAILIVTIFYFIWAFVRIKKQIIVKLNDIQDIISKLSDNRNSLLKNLFTLYDHYFEIRRAHKLYNHFYSFITTLSNWSENLKINFEKWIKTIEEKKEELVEELTKEEFQDSNVIYHALSSSDAFQIVEKQNIFKEFFGEGSNPRIDYFTNDKDEITIESGTNHFIDAIRECSRGNHIYNQMKTVTIFDFLFDNEFLLKNYDTLSPRSLNEKIDIFSQFCRPFIQVKITTDAISPSELVEIQFPKDESDHSHEFLKEQKKIFGTNIQEYDNRNSLTSSIVFFQVKGSLPAYVLKPIRDGFNNFNLLDEKEKKNIHIDESYKDYSCIPESLKSII
jgi:C1A family cysteine protease